MNISNPIAKIRWNTPDEFFDVTDFVQEVYQFYSPDNNIDKGDTFYGNASMLMLKVIIIHLYYKSVAESTSIPTVPDIISFISRKNITRLELFGSISLFPHSNYTNYENAKSIQRNVDMFCAPENDAIAADYTFSRGIKIAINCLKQYNNSMSNNK